MAPEAGDLKGQLMAEAEEAIDKLLAGRGEKESLMLGDIEGLVRTAGQRLMERLTQRLVEAEAEEKGACLCPECGQKMKYKGQKGRHVATETGEVWLERGYYHCPICRQGLFPPGSTVGTE